MEADNIQDALYRGHSNDETIPNNHPSEKKDPAIAKEGDTEDGGAPSEEEKNALRKVPGSIPWVSFVICIAELAERASYFGVSQVFSNYMQFPLPKGGPGTGAVAKSDPNGHSGALNQGLQFASAFGLLFTFLAYVFPILGAYIADVYLGKFKTIMIGVIIGGVAHVIMIGSAAPSVLKAGHGLAPFLISFFMLAVGAGIFKPNVAPTVIDQYTNQKQVVKTLKTGERVIIDPELTIQRVLLIFYAMINVGAFFAIATTYTEKYVGFWLSFLLPGIVYILLPIALLSVYKKLVIKKPAGSSELNNFLRIVWESLKANRFRIWAKDFWDAALPAKLAERGIHVTWTDRAVMDVKRTFSACLIFLYFPIYNINDGGVSAVASNQGAAMTNNGAPTDLLGNFNPLVIIAFSPLLSHGLYPLLSHYGIKFGPIRRMTVGFLLATVSGVIAAIVQWKIYETSPCGYQASTCDQVSPISIWWQVPNVALGAISELFCMVTAYEMAYVRSPPHLKAVVMSFCLFVTALSSALGEILIPAIIDPHLIWVWVGPAVALFVQTIIFWVRHHKLDDEIYMLDQDTPTQSNAVLVTAPSDVNQEDAPAAADLEK
ncbi:Peptide transporter PTR2 [Escovopsis weberi]|uniref:Peptide transporter PTR2 n=1 Tax=Escovopsis weberi TaxID=150374 RepID=A0A0M8MWN1_ESCWE|nr:Peptide transporter PTR2 [Escovopsis weberi]